MLDFIPCKVQLLKMLHMFYTFNFTEKKENMEFSY